jgi:uncharacterized protein YbjT (DUF2867 family)
MTPKDQKILVLGATGNQGGAVLDHLKRQGYTKLHAFVRNPNEAKAGQLANSGITLEVGDLDDPTSFDKAVKEAYGVFSVIPLGVTDVDEEIRRGKAVAAAAKAANVKHFIYSSVGGAERSQGVAHFESKYRIEQYIRELGLPASIVRPVSFMDNFNTALQPQQKDGALVIRMAIHPTTRMQFIAVTDIGRIAADMFSNPEKFMGQAVEIAGDQMTGEEIAQVFARATGKLARFEEQPLSEIAAFNQHFADMFQWFNDHGYNADVAVLRQAYPDMLTLEDWIKQNYKG